MSCETRGITQYTNFTKRSDTIYLNLSKVNIKSRNFSCLVKARPYLKADELLIGTQVTKYNNETPMEY